jgi:putative resolvase
MNEKETKNQPLQAVLYARVSTQKQANSGNLARQIERLTDYAMKKKYPTSHVFKDIASGLNENRQGLQRLLRVVKEQPSIVIVEYKDRLARYGFHYLKQYIEDFGGQLLIMEEVEKDENQELVEDLITITTSFSVRIYGKRGGKKVTKNVECVLKEGEHDADSKADENDGRE